MTVLQSVCSHGHKLQFEDTAGVQHWRPDQAKTTTLRPNAAWWTVDDIACGGDRVWEQAISKLKHRFTFGHWEVGKEKFCNREVVQAADGSMRVGQLAYIKSLDHVHSGN